MKIIQGFSKLTRKEKIKLIGEKCSLKSGQLSVLDNFLNGDDQIQEIINSLTENTMSNFVLPFNVCPNFMINGKQYILPMVIEESSVVAAAGAAAKFWAQHGGFRAQVTDTIKIGQVHFTSSISGDKLKLLFPELKSKLIQETDDITANMRNRGGGILNIELKDFSDKLDNYYQLFVKFKTGNAMGANFINSCLEKMVLILTEFIAEHSQLNSKEKDVDVIMSILSNYTPECKVVCSIETDVENFEGISSLSAKQFVKRFEQAVRIAQIDEYRAVTHNKGIYNGIDAVALATGNDFRAVEACGHAFASRNSSYTSLSNIETENNRFKYTLEVPMALGTVGGLTTVHPLAKLALQMLGNPSAEELMIVAASAGLANNFSAVKSLITTGIQHGHMKLHLSNLLVQLGASDTEKEKVKNHFDNKIISVSEVEKYLKELRNA